MTPEQVRLFCLALRIPISNIRSKGWVEVPCPLAPWRHQKGADLNPSFGIKIDNTVQSFAHCFSCGFTGSLGDLVLEMRQLSDKDKKYNFKQAFEIAESDEEGAGLSLAFAGEEETAKATTIHYFPESFLDSFPSCLRAEDGLLYCQSRAVPKWVVKELDLRFDPIERRVIFPVRDFKGNLVGLHGRAVDKKTKPSYRMYTYPIKHGHNNPQFWFGEHLIDTDKPVVAVESVFDFAVAYEVYRNTACPLTAQITQEKADRMRDVLCMVTMLDGDKAGRRGTEKLIHYLPDTHCIKIHLPEDTDPGQLGVTSIRKLLRPVLEPLVSIGNLR